MNKLLLETALHKLVDIAYKGYFDELIELLKIDSIFCDSLIQIENLINWVRRDSFDQEFLFSLHQDELVTLIKVFTKLDGAVDKFTFGTNTPVPCLLYRLSDLNCEKSKYDEIVDWIFKNRTNKSIFPFGWDAFDDAKSLNEYITLAELKKLKNEEYRIKNNIRGVENRLKDLDKVTSDLIDAIKRRDVGSFDKLIHKGADIYHILEDGQSIYDKIRLVKTEKSKDWTRLHKPLVESLYICDCDNNGLSIIFGDFEPTKEIFNFDCVSLSARYDHGFGFSQLYKFVNDKESEEIKRLCDQANANQKTILLPKQVSSKWRVLLTPVIKTNDERDILVYKNLMADIFNKCHELHSKALYMSQYSLMMSYKNHQIKGIIEAFQELKKAKFNGVEKVYFDVDMRFRQHFYSEFRKNLVP